MLSLSPTRAPCRIALVVLLVVVGSLSSVVAAASAKGVESFDFGTAKTLSSMKEYEEAMATSSRPTLSFFFPDEDMEAVQNTWAPSIKSISFAVGQVGVATYYYTTSSAIGKTVLGGEVRPSIQLVDTVLRRIDGAWSKIPSVYIGAFDGVKIIRWVLEAISPEMIERVDNPRDLLEYLQRYPAFPKVPRILLFTKQNYVGPAYKVLSQALYSEAVFGVVVSPFTTKDKKAVADMYGITKADLPALVVLYPQDSGDADQVKRVRGITQSSTVEEMLRALQPMLPDAFENVLSRTPKEERQALFLAQGKKKMYIATEHDTRRSKVDARRALDEAPQPTVIKDAEAWESFKAELQYHQAFIAFVQPSEVERTTEVFFAATKRIFKEIPSVAREGRIRFFIIEGTSHHAINDFFGVDASNFPQLVFIDASSAQFKFYKHVAALNEDRILHFYITKGADALASGGQNFNAKDMPLFTSEADGYDASDL